MTLEIDFENALVWFDCPRCRGSGIDPIRVGIGDEHPCDPDDCRECGGMRATVVEMRTWASNLAIAGALCAAFRHGFDEGWAVTSEGFNAEHVGQRWKANQREYYELMAAPGWGEGWRPGCGRNAGGGR